MIGLVYSFRHITRSSDGVTINVGLYIYTVRAYACYLYTYIYMYVIHVYMPTNILFSA